MKFIFVLIITSGLAAVSMAQLPIADFNTQSPACINEKLIPVNNSLSSTIHLWDFCLGDFNELPTIADDLGSTIATSSGLKIVQELGAYYGFSINNNKLYRYDFGNNIANTLPLVTDLGDLGVLSNAEGIDILKEGNVWIGVVGYGIRSNAGDLTRIVWNDISQAPTSVENIGNFGFTSGRLREVQIVMQQGNYTLVMPYYNGHQLVRVDFGNSMLNNPGISDIYTSAVLLNVTLPVGMSIVKKQGAWRVVLGSILTKTISVFDLGTDILSAPTHIKSEAFISFNNLSKLKVVREGNNYYGFTSTVNGVLHLVDLKNLNSVDTFQELIIPNMPVVLGIDVVKEGSRHFVLGTQTKLQQLIFEAPCFTSIASSTEVSPEISYLQAGDLQIDLVTQNDLGDYNFITKSIVISPDQAPSINFNNTTLCTSTPIIFSSSSDLSINTYSWNFGDTNTSTDPNPSHTYATAEEYEVELQVQSANGCHNFTRQTIKIYDAPIPGFTPPSGTICTNKDYTFVNNTIDNFDGNLTYEWQVNDVIVSTDRKLVYQFTTEGSQDIKLITTIPGCSVETVQNIANVSLGAVPSFTYDINNTCLSDPITFTNLSLGTSITSYLWNFDDANTSSDTSPTHTYTTAGSYMVSLLVTNVAECGTIYEDEVVIHSLPTTNFSSDLACTDRTTLLSDLSTVDNANITSWGWDFGDVNSGSDNVSSDKDPLHAFSEMGDFDVSLSTISNFGCESAAQKRITVHESPEVSFAFSVECIGEEFHFSDTSSPNFGGSILSRVWNIDGSIYTSQNPKHTFLEEGTYEATLTIRSDNLCSASTTKLIVVNDLPTVDFTLSLSSNCVNTEIIINDNTTLSNDNIVNWHWTVNGEDAGNTSEISYIFDEVATYEVQLRVISERGCIVSIAKNIDFHALPVSGFEISQQYSGLPAEISFENKSEGAVSQEWSFGDASVSSSEFSPTHTYTELGVYDVVLEVLNEAGCRDAITKQIHVVNPSIDLSIGEITSFNDNQNILFAMSNNGTIPVENVTATISFNNDITIQENFEVTLLPDQEPTLKSLSFSVPNSAKTEFVCIELSTNEGSDTDLDNNKQCINIGSDFQILTPYPSPVTRGQEVIIPVIGEKNDVINIGLMNTNGKQFVNQKNVLPRSGLNNIPLSLLLLRPGVYFIQIQHTKSTENFRIFVI